MTEFPETRASLLANVQFSQNREAWEAFSATYQPVIYRMARRRGMQDADAQDMVQEVLLRVSNSIAKYEPQQGIRFRNWLGRVARNTILTALTRSPRLGAGGTDVMEKLEQQVDDATAASQELDNEVMREQFLRAAAVVCTDVNSETWQAFELTVIQGLSCEDAATQLCKSIGTVYAARSRVFKRLRDQIEEFRGAAT